VNRKLQNIVVFSSFSAAIGVGLAALQVIGTFSRIDAACFGLDSWKPGEIMVHTDGILLVLLFSILPGIGVITWRPQLVLLLTGLALAACYGVGTIYIEHFEKMPPFTALFLGSVFSLLRGFGYHPRIDVDWARRHVSFISYRRQDCTDIALLIAAELSNRGLPAFLDISGLQASHFDTQLLHRIEQAQNFILILSPRSLDRIRDEEDWVRKEIEHAIARKKNIIPVVLPGFEFPLPKDLPAGISELPRYQAISYSREFFAATMDKLVEFIMSDAGIGGRM